MLLPQKIKTFCPAVGQTKNTKKNNKKCSLQVQFSRRMIQCKRWLRASCTASCRASFTVEAALVLPVVLFLLCSFLYFLLILNMQVTLYEELADNARKAARYAFAYEELLSLFPSEEGESEQEEDPGLTDILFHGFSSVYTLERMKKEVGREWLDRSCIRNGADGLSLLSDSLISDNRMVDMILRYQVSIPCLPGELFHLLCVQRVRIRTFTGFMPPGDGGEAEGEEQTLVYITETGTVYHTSRYCSHLNLSIKAMDIDNIPTVRNSSGGKYYSCDLCGGISEGSHTVYLTVYGDRYHAGPGCRGLRRSWRAVPLSEAEGRSMCKRCQKQEQKGGG